MGAAEVLDALGHPSRRAVLEALREGPLPVGVLAARLPFSRPATSQHLRVLKSAGLVTETVHGTRHEYAVQPAALALVAGWFEQFWAGALGRFAALAEQDPSAAPGSRGAAPGAGPADTTPN